MSIAQGCRCDIAPLPVHAAHAAARAHHAYLGQRHGELSRQCHCLEAGLAGTSKAHDAAPDAAAGQMKPLNVIGKCGLRYFFFIHSFWISINS